MTRRTVLRRGAVTGGSLTLGGVVATGNAAALSGTIHDGCVTVCHTVFGFTVCGTVCVDDLGIHDEAEVVPGGHNVAVHGHVLGPAGAIATVRTAVAQESSGAVAEGNATLHLDRNHGTPVSGTELVAQNWAVDAATRGPARFEAGSASARAWLHFPGASIRDSPYSDVVFTWTNDSLTIRDR
ncbi:MAG: hypothetical protein ABEJ23_08105 [Haloarculaceae archaeon]